MSNIAVYPGSFNPWHQGHSDILEKALKVFDQVIVGVGVNPDKQDHKSNLELLYMNYTTDRVVVKEFGGLLVDFVRETKAAAVIRGLRNGHDLQYEMNQQYWNEDLGLSVPVVLFICDRNYSHISSSVIRSMIKI